MALHSSIALDSSPFLPSPSSSSFLHSPLPFSPSTQSKPTRCGRRQHLCRLACNSNSSALEEEKVSLDSTVSWSSIACMLWPHIFPTSEAAEAWRLNAWSNMDDVMLFKFSPALQSSPPPRQKQENSDKHDYYVNIGYAIRTLREELPVMFYKDLTYDIYRDDIVFQDPINTFGGIENYKLLFWALRFHGRIFFKALWVEILRVWQPSEKVIMVRWQVRGVPRVPWEAQGIFDGTSEYKLDKDGKIYEHKVDNLALNSQKKFKVPTVADLVRETGCPSTPRPTYFMKMEILFWSFLPYLLLLSWGRYYLALKGTMDLKCVVSPGCSLQPL